MKQPRQDRLFAAEEPRITSIFISSRDTGKIAQIAGWHAGKDSDYEPVTFDHQEMACRAYKRLFEDISEYDTRAGGRLTDDMFVYEWRFIEAYIQAYIETQYHRRADAMAKPALKVAEKAMACAV